ncbi:MAG: DUF4430 domain-containing protein [Ruminococcaceae bacterium]|nr:DUF4430 domain-containing protein [Oscillospiraceae bacterium]
MKRIIALIMALLSVMVFCGCEGEVKDTSSPDEKVFRDGDVVGEGEKSFEFSVKYEDGKTEKCIVKTDKKTVGEALIENGIITGEDGKYGLYVKTVNGVLADFDKTKTYWAFYINGEYATSGVDSTEIKKGEKYSFEIGK